MFIVQGVSQVKILKQKRCVHSIGKIPSWTIDLARQKLSVNTRVHTNKLTVYPNR